MRRCLVWLCFVYVCLCVISNLVVCLVCDVLCDVVWHGRISFYMQVCVCEFLLF